MIKPIQVKALERYRIWVRFEDGIEGEFDLKGFLSAWQSLRQVERLGVF